MLDTPRRSAFVTGLAWSFIGPGVLMAFVAALQLLAVLVVAPPSADMMAGARTLGLPQAFDFFFAHAVALSWAFFAFAVGTVICGVGLERRRNWARLATIALLVLTIALNFAGGAIDMPNAASLTGVPIQGLGDLQADVQPDLDGLIHAIGLLIQVLVYAFSALCAWFIYRLNTRKVREEFKS